MGDQPGPSIKNEVPGEFLLDEDFRRVRREPGGSRDDKDARDVMRAALVRSDASVEEGLDISAHASTASVLRATTPPPRNQMCFVCLLVMLALPPSYPITLPSLYCAYRARRLAASKRYQEAWLFYDRSARGCVAVYVIMIVLVLLVGHALVINHFLCPATQCPVVRDATCWRRHEARPTQPPPLPPAYLCPPPTIHCPPPNASCPFVFVDSLGILSNNFTLDNPGEEGRT